MRLSLLASIGPLFTAILTLSPSALALRGAPGVTGAEETAPGVPPGRGEPRVVWDRAPAQRAAALRSFVHATAAATGPAPWRALWDADTGAPKQIFGGFIEAPGAVASPAAAEAHARALLSRFGDLLAPGVDPADFEVLANDLHGGLRAVGFQQMAAVGGARGPRVRVVGARFDVRFKNDRLFLFGATSARPAAFAAPRVTPAAATQAAVAWTRGAHGSAVPRGAPELVVHRVVRPRAEDLRLAFRVEVDAASPRGAYAVYIDASTGAPIARASLLRFATEPVLFDAPVRGPQGARMNYPAPLLDVSVDAAPTTTDAAGLVTWSGAVGSTLGASVHGRSITVRNAAGADSTASFPLGDGSSIVWSMADDEFGDAELSSFIHAGRVQAHARGFAPDLAWLESLVEVEPSEDDPMGCNAFWDGFKLNFYRQNDTCENTARVADVVYHEFGHGFHQNAFLFGAGNLDAALGEGTGDYMAVTNTGDPALGPGFFLADPTAPLRRVDTGRVWPEDISPDPHETGLIWAGSMWDLRVALSAEQGDAGVGITDVLYYQAIRSAGDIPSTYAEVLAADDDDGDLGNGTPHICDINRAFARHGLSGTLDASGLTLVHTPLTNVKAGAGPLPLTVGTKRLYPMCDTGLEPPTIDAVYALSSGTPYTVHLAPSEGDATTYVGEIPELPYGVSFGYHLDARVGDVSTALPDNVADPDYDVFVADVDVIRCFDFEQDNGGFVLSPPLGTGFGWGTPQGAGGDPAEAFSGTHVLGTTLGGQGTYRPSTHVSATSPTVDLGGARHVRLQYRRWLTVEDGFFDQASITANGSVVFRNIATSEADGTFDFIDREWRFVDIDVANEAAQGLSVVFDLTADGGKNYGGWNIDDVCFVSVKDAPAQATGAGGGGGGGPGDDASGSAVSGDGCGCTIPGNDDAPSAPPVGLTLTLAALAWSRRRPR